MYLSRFSLAGFLAVAGPCWLAAANQYVQHNLVSDLQSAADRVDPALVNPWGIVASPTSPFWVSANGTGLSTLYDGNGAPASLIVSVPGPASASNPGKQCGKTTLGAGAPS